MVANIKKAWRRSMRLSRILCQDRSYPRTSKNFYKAVFQAKLLFGKYAWVMYPRIGRNLDGFYHRVARWMARIQPRRDTMGRWGYPLLHTSTTELVLEKVDTYILRRHNTTAQYITTSPILELWLSLRCQT